MKGKVFAITSAISALLFMILLLLAVKDRVVADDVFVATGGRVVWCIWSGNGSLSILRYRGWPDPPGIWHRFSRAFTSDTAATPLLRQATSPRNVSLPGLLELSRGIATISVRKNGSTVDWGHWALGGAGKWDWSPPASFWSIELNYEPLIPVLIVLPVAWLLLWNRSVLRQRSGRCRACGYNLTGNVSGVCPECGAPIPQTSETVA